MNTSILYLEKSNDSEIHEEIHMEVVRKYVDASSLMTIMKLPDNFKNKKLEVIILPTEEKESVEKKENVKDIVQSLVGAIPYTDKTLSELRDK